MSKTFLVTVSQIQHKEKTNVIWKIGAVVGVFLLINYFIFQSFIETLTKLNHIENIDIEVLGILIGIIISYVIGLIVFIAKKMHGFSTAILTSAHVMLYSSTFLMVLCSLVVPIMIAHIAKGIPYFTFKSFVASLLGNTFFLLLATPLILLLGLVLISIIGSVLAFFIYKLVYKWKSFQVKKTKYWQELMTLCKTEDFKQKALTIELSPHKIKFWSPDQIIVGKLSFENLGYAALKPLTQLTFIAMLQKQLKTPLKIKERTEIGAGSIFTIRNCYLQKKIDKGREFYTSRRKRLRQNYVATKRTIVKK